MDPKNLSDVELKAFGYDCLANIEFNTKNLNAINQELSRRAQSPIVEKTEEVIEPVVEKENADSN